MSLNNYDVLQTYSQVLLEFRSWCERNDLNFRIELMNHALRQMGRPKVNTLPPDSHPMRKPNLRRRRKPNAKQRKGA